MRPGGQSGAHPCDLRSTHRLLRGEWDPSRADHRLHNTRAGRSWSSPCRDRLGGVAGRFMSGLGSHLWWHVSVLSGGPGPWRCLRCDESDSDAWLDGHVVGAPVSCLAQPFFFAGTFAPFSRALERPMAMPVSGSWPLRICHFSGFLPGSYGRPSSLLFSPPSRTSPSHSPFQVF